MKTTSNRHVRKEALLMSGLFIPSQHLYVKTWWKRCIAVTTSVLQKAIETFSEVVADSKKCFATPASQNKRNDHSVPLDMSWLMTDLRTTPNPDHLDELLPPDLHTGEGVGRPTRPNPHNLHYKTPASPDYVTVTLQGGPKKTAHYTLVHIFAKYWPIFIILSPTHSVGNLQ